MDELVSAAWVYMLLHNKKFPESPLYVTETGQLTDKPPCIEQFGIIAHKGHGPGTKCLSPKTQSEEVKDGRPGSKATVL